MIKGLWGQMPLFMLGARNVMPGTVAAQRISKMQTLTP